MPAKKTTEPRIERTRRIIFRTFVGLLAALVGAGLLYSFGAFDPLVVKGGEYAIVPGTAPPTATAPITVTEFFSYGCVHCNDFDPQVESWRKDLPPGVTFARSPVVFGSAQYAVYARAYFTLLGMGALDQNHSRLFAEIHQRGRQMSDDLAIAQFVDGHGATQETMRRAMTSPRVAARVDAAQLDEQKFGVQEIPALVVGGHYRIDIGNVGRAQALHIATRLIEAIRRGKAPGAPAAAPLTTPATDAPAKPAS